MKPNTRQTKKTAKMNNGRIDCLLKSNRSIREFDRSRALARDELEALIECTRYCASSANIQPLKYRAVYKSSEAAAVFSAVRFGGYLPKDSVPAKGNECGSFIVICLDKSISQNAERFLIDVGIAAQSVTLKATEAGLGGCVMTSFDEAAVKSALALAEQYKVMAVIALGAPKEHPVIVDAKDDIKYYRENGVHYVPKRTLSELLIPEE